MAPVERRKKRYTQEEVRKLLRKHFHVSEVRTDLKTEIRGNTLYLRENIAKDAIKVSPLLKSLTLEVLTPDKYDQYSNTVLDCQPIAVKSKESAHLGEGETYVLSGVVILLTGTSEKGLQITDAGSCEGNLLQQIEWDAPGCPDKGDIMLRLDAKLDHRVVKERCGPLAIHKAGEYVSDEIRQAMRNLPLDISGRHEIFTQFRRDGKKKVVIVKEVMGQGAMHEKFLMPAEPVGLRGGKSIIELGNLPMTLSPLEVLDGAIHSLCCVTPATKETSRHYWREPLVLEALRDTDLDLCGVIVVGSPESGHDKLAVAERLGMCVEAADVDGAIIVTEGWGNNDVDFAAHIEQVGKRGLPVVGMCFSEVTADLVVGNKYMSAMVNLGHMASFEEEAAKLKRVLGHSCTTRADALRALAMLKALMAGGTVEPTKETWNPEIPRNNQALIEKASGTSGVSGLQSETRIPLTLEMPVWTPFTKELKDCKVALVTTTAVHLPSQEEFTYTLTLDPANYRVIPNDTNVQELVTRHGGFDHTDLNKDKNVVFPVDRLNELAKEGFIREASRIHVSTKGGPGRTDFFEKELGNTIAKILKEEGVDAVVLTAG